MNINMRMRTVYDSYDIDNDRFAFAVFKMAAVQSKKQRQRQRGKSGEESTFVQHFGKLFNCVCVGKGTYLPSIVKLINALEETFNKVDIYNTCQVLPYYHIRN